MIRSFLISLACTIAPAIAAAPPTLADLWDGRATWNLAAEKLGGDFNFHYISIAPHGGKLMAYYIVNSVDAAKRPKMGIGRAQGRDGIKWTDDGAVINVGPAGAWDDRLASFPGIWKDGDTWYLVYEGAADDAGTSTGDIGLATSTDGKTFTKHPANPILRHEKTGWERANIGTPSLFKENGVWYLFYHGYDWSVCQIGVASGKSLTDLTKSPANPIIPVAAEPTAWDCGTTGKRSTIHKDGEYYYMMLEGSTAQPYQTARWSSGLARTTDLTARWTKCPRNPLIPTTAGSFGYDGPELVKINNAWHLYVRSAENVGTKLFMLQRP